MVDAPPPAQNGVGFCGDQQIAGKFWDGVVGDLAQIPLGFWWSHQPTLRHINRLVCGENLEGQHAGFHRRLAKLLTERSLPAPRAISVGSGIGGKEIQLVRDGIVATFDCFELSDVAVREGRSLADFHGVAERVRFHNANAFATDLPADFDLVYWNSALHHMFDAKAAVAWSFERLRHGGLFAADEYVGANRFQHEDGIFDWANRMLALLPDRLLRRPDPAQGLVPRHAMPVSIIDQIRIDPSEAVDSAAILPAVHEIFPDAEVIRTGGALYFVALWDAFHNFASEGDMRLLDALLLLDAAVGRLHETQFAVIFAVKP